ncbi:MAG: leucine-rich repeat protein [Alistipes sp.]|nr:leucine-rich repeat protein [Alistipes sp.]
MKRLFTLLLIAFSVLSCEVIDEKLDDLLDKRDWVVFADGTELTVDVPSKPTVLNYKFESTLDWEAKTDAEWLEIDPTSGKAGKDIKIQIKVAKNKDKEGRTGYVDLTLSNDESYRITVNQAGEGDENDEGDENENEGTIVDVPANQIWYTSVDGAIVEPYSGEYNEYAEAITTFGVNIVSNTYVDGKGVIEFDGDVTEIGLGAFYDCNELTSVILPDSVIVIKKGAFYGCINLNSVNIPDGVQEIGFDAFCGCTAIRTVTIPESVSFIDDGAFVVCNSMERFNGKFASEDGRCLIIDGVLKAFAPAGLTEYTIPDNVTKIGHAVFLLYSNLENIIIPDSVTEIDNWVFQGCTSLASVTIGNSVTEIGYYAFCDCSNLTSVTIPDSVTTIGNNAFYSCSRLTSVTIPNSVTTIEEGLFRFCSSLASVTIPDSVTTIGSFAFDDCNSLTSVTIPGSVTTIGYNAFSNCSSLTSVTIGDSVTEIGYNAFYDCINLTSITIPDSVTTIGSSAFQDCTSLASVTIGNSVTDIGGGAFYNCKSLTSVTIPDSVTEIGDYAFYGCDSLTSVTIGDSVTKIGYATFAFCENLNTVYCKAINPPTTIVDNNGYWYGFAMQDESGNICNIDCTIYVYAECVEAYKNAEGWSEYADRIVAEGSIPEDTQTSIIRYTTIDGEPITPRMAVKSNTYINGEGILEFYGDIIGDSAFYGCDSLTSITIGDSVTSIGYNAFSNCSSLTSVTIPDSVTTVGGYAFSGCGNLNAVYITDLVAWCNIDFVNPINNGFQLEANPLAHAQNLYLNGELITELVIPESVTDIKFLAFIGCSASNIVFHDNVKSIGACAFEHCQNLDNVVIGNSVESIGNVAFGRCPNLTSVTMSDSLTSFGFNVFLYSSNLREFKGKLATEDGRALIKDNILFTYANASGSEYIIPDGITIIGDGAFFSSVGLKSITIPKSVTTIGYLAFGMITDIESIYCKATTPPSTGGNIYESNSCNIYVPFESYQDYVTAGGWSQYAASILPYDYDNNCVIEANASEETKRWLGKWSSTVSRTYCPQTGFNEETVTFEVNIEHNAVAPNFVKVYGLSVIDPTIAVDGIVNANGDLEILNFNYIGNSGEWALYVWALSEVGGLTGDRHAVYTMSMDESGRVSCEVGSFNSSPYIVFDIFGYNVNTGGVSWYNTNISYYSGPMSWVKIADNGATPSRYSQKISYRHNLRLQADARLRVVE